MSKDKTPGQSLNDIKTKQFRLPYEIQELIIVHNCLENGAVFKNLKLDFKLLTKLELNNNLLEVFDFTVLPDTLIRLNLASNKLKSAGPFGHLPKLKVLLLHNNQISELKGDMSQLKSLKELSLAYNELSELPVGFENLNPLTLLRLDNNKFNYKKSDLNLTLWNRIPRVQNLHLSGNQLGILPHQLAVRTKKKPSKRRGATESEARATEIEVDSKELTCERLYASECDLHYICPTFQCVKANLVITKNPLTLMEFVKSDGTPVTGEIEFITGGYSDTVRIIGIHGHRVQGRAYVFKRVLPRQVKRKKFIGRTL